MANLGLNSLWGDVKKKDPDVEAEIRGPDYDYAKNVGKPSSKGVGTEGSFDQLGRNLGAVGSYVNTLVGSRSMGDNYFVNTGGTCTAPDGSIQARFNYVNNESEGLVFGVVEDIGGLNPVYLINSLTASSSQQTTRRLQTSQQCSVPRCHLFDLLNWPMTTHPQFL